MNAMSRAALLAALALTLTACSSEAAEAPASSAAAEHHDDEAAEHAFADHLMISDTWVKAADSGMTAAFGVIMNHGDHDVIIVGAHSDAASEVQLHEVVDEKMQQVEGGLVVPAGGTLILEPGGFHLMFMGIPAAIAPGDEIEVTLEIEDGSELTFTAVAKEFTGGNEQYDGGMNMDMDMDMGSASPSASASMDMNG